MSLDVKLTTEVFRGNLTHNLTDMADACGLYEPLWRPHRLMGKTDDEEDMAYIWGRDLILPLQKGVEELRNNPDKYKKLNPENGWGDYEGLLRVAEEYLAHCQVYPNAEVGVCR